MSGREVGTEGALGFGKGGKKEAGRVKETERRMNQNIRHTFSFASFASRLGQNLHMAIKTGNETS